MRAAVPGTVQALISAADAANAGRTDRHIGERSPRSRMRAGRPDPRALASLPGSQAGGTPSDTGGTGAALPVVGDNRPLAGSRSGRPVLAGLHAAGLSGSIRHRGGPMLRLSVVLDCLDTALLADFWAAALRVQNGRRRQ